MLQWQSLINFICSRPSWWLVLRFATGTCTQKLAVTYLTYQLGGGVYWEVVAASFLVQSMYLGSWLCFVLLQKVITSGRSWQKEGLPQQVLVFQNSGPCCTAPFPNTKAYQGLNAIKFNNVMWAPRPAEYDDVPLHRGHFCQHLRQSLITV